MEEPSPAERLRGGQGAKPLAAGNASVEEQVIPMRRYVPGIHCVFSIKSRPWGVEPPGHSGTRSMGTMNKGPWIWVDCVTALGIFDVAEAGLGHDPSRFDPAKPSQAKPTSQPTSRPTRRLCLEKGPSPDADAPRPRTKGTQAGCPVPRLDNILLSLNKPPTSLPSPDITFPTTKPAADASQSTSSAGPAPTWRLGVHAAAESKMHLSAEALHAWDARDGHQRAEQTKGSKDTQTDGGSSNTTTIALVVVAVIILLLLVGIVWFCRSRKAKKSSSLEPTDEPKKKGFFGRITGRLRGGRYEQTSGDDSDRSHQLNSTGSRRNGDVEAGTNRGSTATGAVDRNTSVRSIMTLPAYRQMAATNEQVLGREGERDGVDVIVDLPNQEEEEELRDREMETMYQIRTTRRQLIAEREERREQRREARLRNDAAALQDIRARTRAANQDTTITDLRTTVDQIKDTRNRSVSSVSYADVGVARHDGTRIRANSTESERVGLLEDAGSITLGHNRGRSASSAASADTDFMSLTPTHTRGESLSGGPWVPNGSARTGSSTELVEADLGDTTMPPPEYHDLSLSEENRSTTPLHEPPPDYPGPYRSASQRTQRSLTTTARPDGEVEPETEPETETRTQTLGRGVGGVPQLPSLRISRLPEIVIEPSSAHP
ncbi:hypothetical protein G7Z17_g7725 [Cylindrodendrum hubeiense]|uniref:Uncharacterized protein n=1 Tax=Cylindrodendrum hubeiense TaxID=595255 RepID=A0A9P5H7T5_9HYPO|nr:hypothetical protein G7Z17_g7725 [Cylindrodendrum hubeiense]